MWDVFCCPLGCEKTLSAIQGIAIFQAELILKDRCSRDELAVVGHSAAGIAFATGAFDCASM